SCRVHFHTANRDTVCGCGVDNRYQISDCGIPWLPPNHACVEHILRTVTVVNTYPKPHVFGVRNKDSLPVPLQLTPLDLFQYTTVNSANVVEQQGLHPKEVSITLGGT